MSGLCQSPLKINKVKGRDHWFKRGTALSKKIFMEPSPQKRVYWGYDVLPEEPLSEVSHGLWSILDFQTNWELSQAKRGFSTYTPNVIILILVLSCADRSRFKSQPEIGETLSWQRDEENHVHRIGWGINLLGCHWVVAAVAVTPALGAILGGCYFGGDRSNLGREERGLDCFSEEYFLLKLIISFLNLNSFQGVFFVEKYLHLKLIISIFNFIYFQRDFVPLHPHNMWVRGTGIPPEINKIKDRNDQFKERITSL